MMDCGTIARSGCGLEREEGLLDTAPRETRGAMHEAFGQHTGGFLATVSD